MTRLSEGTGHALRVFTMCSFSAICLLMVLSVASRFLPLGSTGWSDEIIELLLVWTVFMAIAEVWRQGQHFQVGVVPDLLRGSIGGVVLEMFTAIGCLVFLVTFIWQATDLMLQANDVSPIFSWSRRWWYLPLPISGLLMTLFSLHRLFARLRGGWRSPPVLKEGQP
ncbi:MAG: TRAP transporter small permease [Rubrivivax sp.]